MEAIFGTLHNGPILLGHLIHSAELDMPEFSQDFPFSSFKFEASPQFAQFRPLFNSVLGAMKLEDQEQWDLAWKKINSLQLVLKLHGEDKKFIVRAPIEREDSISLFQNPTNAQLYLDDSDEKAWFRLW